MLNPKDVAVYFLQKDKDHRLFDPKKLKELNGRTFYVGNARLNKYLHIAQNVYIAMTGEKLMDVDFLAYDNGAVTEEVMGNYQLLFKNLGTDIKLSDFEIKYLNKIFNALKNANLDELIAISHEDPEWEEKSKYYSKSDQRMDSLSRQKEYREQYRDFIKILDRMSA